MEALLSTKSSALCFKKEEFIVKEFSVDKFVSECRKYASLETMREDLSLYHKILCSAMVELINKDYADFVNLSSNLVGLDKSIKNLTSPLQSLKSEIEQIKCNLGKTLDTANCMFMERASVHGSKVLVQHVVSVLEGLEKIENLDAMSKEQNESLQSEALERIALDFNLVQFHMSKISSMKVLDHKKEEVEKVARNIEEHLETMFLQSISRRDVPSLQKVLRIYSVISKEREVETCFCQSVVRPFMRKLITQQNIMRHGLSKVFSDILGFIPKYCSDILNVTRGAKKYTEVVPGFDFLVNAVWPEVILCFEYVAPVYIYAPGDPQLFHQNFSASMQFLEQFEHCCEVQSSVKRLRGHSSYKQFLKKWNLDVYFQIRFQEIAGRFESALLEAFAYNDDDKSAYILEATSSLWYCLNLCWDKGIFLLPLRNHFWKLTLQLISRYSVWAQSLLKSEDDRCSLSAVQTAFLIKDVELLLPEIRILFSETIKDILCNKASNSCIESAFSEAMKLLENIPPVAGRVIVKLLIIKCSSHLRLITDIPRLYRKTNREVPSKASGYVAQVFNPLTEFLTETNSVLSTEWKKYCLQEVVEGIVKQCVIMIQDVLTSIKKMEDSLKILKRARDKPVGQTSSGAITDDDKIRRQLTLDVNYLEELVQKSGLKVEEVRSFKELKELVTSAERISPFSNKT